MSVMKIDGIPPVGGVQPISKTSPVSRDNKSSEQDKVAVSDNAQVFQKLIQKAKELPDVREDRVKAITEQIARGDFSLDGDSIAASMLSSEKTEGK